MLYLFLHLLALFNALKLVYQYSLFVLYHFHVLLHFL